MKKRNLVIILLLSIATQNTRMHASNSTNFNPVSKNTLSLLTDTLEVNIQQADTLPTDISFLFADLKYQGTELKICEFGGVSAGMGNTNVLINGKKEILVRPFWGHFWHYLKQFEIPIWNIKLLEIMPKMPPEGTY